MAAPHAVTAALAAPPALVDLPGPATPLPLATLAIVAVQLGGVLLARELELPAWRRIWLSALATTAALFPVLALQTALSRVPFVSLARGSAGPLIWTTAGAVAVVLGVAALMAILGADAPENASLLFAPAALLVPAVLGAPGDLAEGSALAALSEAAGLTAGAVWVGWLAPPGARPLVAPVALGLQFGVLWLLGYGPRFPPGGGAIVPLLASALLVVTVLATVLTPVAALLVRRLRGQRPEARGQN